MCKIAARSFEISQFSLSVNINTCGKEKIFKEVEPILKGYNSLYTPTYGEHASLNGSIISLCGVSTFIAERMLEYSFMSSRPSHVVQLP